MTPTPPTVERALVYLSSQCDGAASADGQGFNGTDSPFGKSLARQVEAERELSGKQTIAAYRMLRKYRGQLARVGIDYDAIRDPERTPTLVAPAEQRKSGGSAAVEVTIEGGRIMLKTPFRLKDLVKTIPNARWNPQRKMWTYPESAGQASAIRDVMRQQTMTAPDEFWALCERREEQMAAAVHKTNDALDDVPIRGQHSAWMHQRQAFWFAREQDAAMLAMDMGTGKSRVTIDLLQNYLDDGAQRVLIVCPSKVLGVWPKQFRLHASPDRPWHVVNGMHAIKRGRKKGMLAAGSVAQRVKDFEAALYDCRCGKRHAVVVNYEALAHAPLKTWAPKALDYVVFDEIHKIKAANGTWSRWCARVGKLATRRLGLTGTPMPQSPLDVFAQYRALDPTIFGNNYRAFESLYAVKGGYGGYEVLGLKNEDDLHRKFHSIAYEVGAEVLDLPESTDTTLTCMLGKEGAKTYDGLESAMWAEIEGQEITLANVLVKMLRLQQITGGGVGTDSGEVVEIDTAKANLLRDTLDDIGRVDKTDPKSAFEPVVVFCRFVHDLDAIEREVEASGRRYREVSGRRSDGLTEDSTMHEDCDVIGVQIQAGGTGVDFTRACYAIYYSLGFSLGDYLQSRRRVLRPGQDRSVRFIHLVAATTIDEQVYEALAAREEIVDYVMHKAGEQGGTDPEVIRDFLAASA